MFMSLVAKLTFSLEIDSFIDRPIFPSQMAWSSMIEAEKQAAQDYLGYDQSVSSELTGGLVINMMLYFILLTLIHP